MELISRMRLTAVTYRPATHARRPPNHRRHTPTTSRLPDNWRQKALIDTHRRVREKDDEDYETIVGCINKLSKPQFEAMLKTTLEALGKRDELFRLRVATLLFDRGIRQNFFAPMMADFIQAIVKSVAEMREDVQAQIQMFDTLYDAANVTLVPSASDPGFEDAIIAWTKQKETKRGYAVFIGELFQRGLVPHDTMDTMLTAVLDDLQKSAHLEKTEATMEHVDHLGRFLFAVAPNLRGWKGSNTIVEFLAVPKPEVPSLNMKTRFKLEDALKILQSSPAA